MIDDMLDNKTLVIARGVPGAGKSSFAYLISNYVCEADDYHYLDSGDYDWKPENVHKSHIWCQNRCERFMKLEREKIVVSNTFTTERELKPYYELAEKYDYNVVSLIVENRHGGKNTHNVSDETIEKMRNRLVNNIAL